MKILFNRRPVNSGCLIGMMGTVHAMVQIDHLSNRHRLHLVASPSLLIVRCRPLLARMAGHTWITMQRGRASTEITRDAPRRTTTAHLRWVTLGAPDP